MKRIDLSRHEWQVCGWRPFGWQLSYSMEMGAPLNPDIPAVPAQIPGSVQAALRRAKILPDWNVGLNSRLCEWVENRHWEFSTDIQMTGANDEPIILHAEGLDYSGWILVDGKLVAPFKGTLVPHEADLTQFLCDGARHRLSIVFDEPPNEQGQIGFTSRSRFFKPRYNYSWDWCPRFVPIGIWDAIYLQQAPDRSEITRLNSSTSDDLSAGEISFCVETSAAVTSASVSVTFNGATCVKQSFPITRRKQDVIVKLDNITLWWPLGEGPQALYSVQFQLTFRDGRTLTLPERQIGFKKVRWLPCSDAPSDAEPWICEINGKAISLRGVNWTPISLDFHSVTDDEYRARIDLYREMNCNILRVWGGGFLEKEIFYQLCDEAGIFVWQEFPLSSSGIDNWAPEDSQVVENLCYIAASYIRRRGHHASKLLWCGGNELQSASGKKTGAGVPLTFDHPCLAALADVVTKNDPDTRFLPTSASGPQFCAAEENFGKGMHHDVHGPWNLNGSLKEYQRYWSHDDALFRSELGMPGTSPADLIEKYRGEYSPWPPTPENPYWMHAGAWWMQWNQLKEQLSNCPENEAWRRYALLSSELQAECLSMAARACLDRFPSCGGLIIWMGHDAFPCLANTSIIDFEGRPKPAFYALKAIFTAHSVKLPSKS